MMAQRVRLTVTTCNANLNRCRTRFPRITSGATSAGKFNGLYLFRGGNGVAILTGDQVYGSNVTGNAVYLQVGPDSNMTFKEDPIN